MVRFKSHLLSDGNHNGLRVGHQGCASFPLNFVETKATLLSQSGSNVQLVGSKLQSTSKETAALTVKCLSPCGAARMGVATSIEITVWPAFRLEYSQNGVSGLIPRSQVIETRLS